MNPFRESVVERFWRQVDMSAGADGCWPWTSYRDNRSGYGRFRVDGVGWLPHRWVLGLHRGESLGRGELACHHCDNPPCCNPAHLYVGDQFTNMRDSVARGRHFEARKTHCKSGHPLSGGNLYRHPTSGQRCCRACRRGYSRKAA